MLIKYESINFEQIFHKLLKIETFNNQQVTIKLMKKVFTLITAMFITMGMSAQTESYKPIVVDGDNITLAPEFAAIVDADNNATNIVDGKSIVTISTANMTLEAVGGATIADKKDPEDPKANLGQDLTPGAVISADDHTYEIASVGSWNPISWKSGNNKLDINDAAGTKLYFVMGTGNPYVKMFCEEVYTDGEPTGKYRAQYEYYVPGGQTMPLVGLYYKFTPKVDGTLRVQVWANKGNRHTYVIDDVTKQAVKYSAEGYINGQRANSTKPVMDPETGEQKLDNQGNPIWEQYQVFFTAEQIDSIHKAMKCTTDTLDNGEVVYTETDPLYGPYIIAGGNQAFWGWITFKVEAGKSYWLFQDSSQVGFGGYEFNTGGEEPPVGNDLTEIAAAAVAEGGEVVINLEAGAQYTMSGPITRNNITIAGVEGSNAKVKMAAGTAFAPAANITLKNLDINASELGTSALIALNASPIESSLNAEGGYYIINKVEILNCNISDVPQIISDNGVKYCVGNMTVDNCVVSLKATAAKTVFDMSKQGFINDLTVKNSTFCSKGTDQDYFVRYNNSGRCDRAGFASNSITFDHNTFYNVAKGGQWGNYSGFAGRNTSYWTMTANIFVDCGNGQVARRYLGGRANQATATFKDNTYWFDVAAEDTGDYDNSGTAIASDPQLKDPANGDFTPQGAEQVAAKTGDPRWLSADGISQMVVVEDNANAPVYNLAGQRVAPNTKGILVKNGRKFINK